MYIINTALCAYIAIYLNTCLDFLLTLSLGLDFMLSLHGYELRSYLLPVTTYISASQQEDPQWPKYSAKINKESMLDLHEGHAVLTAGISSKIRLASYIWD